MTDTSAPQIDEAAIASQVIREILPHITDNGPELHTPGEDEGPEETLVFLTNGGVRAWVGDKRHWLKRPNLGELEQLHVALETTLDAINAASVKAEAEGEKLKERQEQINGDPDMTGPQRRAKHREVTRRDQKIARELRRETREQQAAWWTEVFRVLSQDGAPEELPGWVVDQNLPSQMMRHWQTVPLGRGVR